MEFSSSDLGSRHPPGWELEGALAGVGAELAAAAQEPEAAEQELAGVAQEPEAAEQGLAAVAPEPALAAVRELALELEPEPELAQAVARERAQAVARERAAAEGPIPTSKTRPGRRSRRTSRHVPQAWSGIRSTRSASSGTAACFPTLT